MKNIRNIGLFFLSLFVAYSCTPDEFDGAKESGIPVISGRQIEMEVDQTTNTATFKLTGDMKGCYAVWYIDEDESAYSILNPATYSSLKQGEHTVQARLMNRNGISQGQLESSFEFLETKADYSTYFNNLCDKEWRIENETEGHLGCGGSGTDGSEWWSAGANEKAAYGVYENRVYFSHADEDDANSGTYTFDPGSAGTVYVNIDNTVSEFTQYKGDATDDYTVPAEKQVTTFALETGVWNEEDVLYIHFPAHTYLPYIGYDAIWEDPIYRIEKCTADYLYLVCDNGDIAWRMQFVSYEEGASPSSEVTYNFDWDPDRSDNIWASVETEEKLSSMTVYFASTNNWVSADPQPEPIHNTTDKTWTITLPDPNGTEEWQAQFQIHASIDLDATKTYCLYLCMAADNDMPNTHIKLTEDGDGNDGNYLTDGRYKSTGGETYVFKNEKMTFPEDKFTTGSGIALVFDFAGAPAGTNVTISNIYLAEVVTADDERNLWQESAINESGVSQYMVGPGWAENTFENNATTYSHNTDGSWEIDIPAGLGSEQWQGQFHIPTTINLNANKTYGFSCTFEAEGSQPSTTIKVTDLDSDGNYLFENTEAFPAGTNIYKLSGTSLSNGATTTNGVKLVFDFAGAPEGTIKISDIVLYEDTDSE